MSFFFLRISGDLQRARRGCPNAVQWHVAPLSCRTGPRGSVQAGCDAPRGHTPWRKLPSAAPWCRDRCVGAERPVTTGV